MSKTFLDVLEELEKTSGTNDKIRIIADNKDVEHLIDYLVIALDKRYIYGIKKIQSDIRKPMIVEGGWKMFNTLIENFKLRHLTGHNAQHWINAFLDQCTEQEKKWYTKAILKDLASVGLGVGLVNKAVPKAIYDYDCMLAMQEEKLPRMVYPAHVPLKYDGVRGQVFIDSNGKVFSFGWPGLFLPLGRSGLPFYQLDFMVPYIEDAVKSCKTLRNIVLDGEFHVNHNLNDAQTITGFEAKTEEDFRGKTGKVGKGWQDHLKRKEEVDKLKADMKFVVFDLLRLDEWETQTCTRTEEERYYELQSVLLPSIVLSNSAHKIDVQTATVAQNEEEARAIASKNMENGYEGAIVKSLSGVYEWKRSYNWIKIKEEVEADVLILDVVKGETKYNGDGTPKPDMMGKFTVTDGTRTFEVGTGKSWGEVFRTEVWNNPENYIGRVMKITAQYFTDDAAIQPRFHSWRDDKSREDILGKN